MTREPSATPRPAKPACTFSRQNRILRSADFRKIYDNGIRVSSALFATFCLRRESPDCENGEGARLGITVPRAVGSSVVRNRIRRRIREVFRLQRAEIEHGWDIVINPRRTALDAPFSDLCSAFRRVIEKCNSR